MATIFKENYSGDYGYLYEFKAEASESNVDAASNTSKVTVNIYLRRTNSSSNGAWNSNGTDWTIDIAGKEYSGTSTWDTRNTSAWQLIGSASRTITHNEDGSKTITIAATHEGNSASGASKMGNSSGSGEFELTEIPRYATVTQKLSSKTLTSVTMKWTSDSTIDYIWYSSDNGSNWTGINVADGKSGSYTISGLKYNTTYKVKTRVRRKDSQLKTDSSALSVTTYDIARISSAPSINIGESHEVKWTNPSGENVSLKLCKTDNTIITDYGNVTGTSKITTPDADTLYKLTPNSNTLRLKYVITTGSVGSSEKTVDFIVSNSDPIFSNFEYQDVNETTVALTGNNQILVKGYSNVKGKISVANIATAKNYATMKSYKLVVGSKTGTSPFSDNAEVIVPSEGSITQIESGTLEMYAVDSRGNSSKVTKEATVKNYVNIKIATLEAKRTGNVGAETTLSFSAKYWNESFGQKPNTITSCTYRYKRTSESQYVEGTTGLTYSITDETVTGSVIIAGDKGADGFDVSNSYNIQLIISDELTSAYATIILGNGIPSMAIGKKGISFGAPYDENEGGLIQLAPSTYIDNEKGAGLNAMNSDIVGVNSLYFYDESSLSNHEGINFLKENGDKTNYADYEVLRGYRGNVYYDESRLLKYEDLYYKSGESITIKRFITGGYLTASKTSVRFCIPLPKRTNDVTPTITGGNVTVRGIGGGYLLDNDNIKNATITTANYDNYFIVYLTYGTAFDVTNNTPLAVDVGELVINFS